MIKVMTINDYEELFELWQNTANMGLRSLDDSKEGISCFLKRNPNTNFVVYILYRLCCFPALEAAETQAFSALNVPLATPCFAPYRSCSRALLWDG